MFFNYFSICTHGIFIYKFYEVICIKNNTIQFFCQSIFKIVITCPPTRWGLREPDSFWHINASPNQQTVHSRLILNDVKKIKAYNPGMQASFCTDAGMPIETFYAQLPETVLFMLSFCTELYWSVRAGLA